MREGRKADTKSYELCGLGVSSAPSAFKRFREEPKAGNQQ